MARGALSRPQRRLVRLFGVSAEQASEPGPVVGETLEMEDLRRLVVHVHEAMEMATDPSDADRQRLALLLFDSAAELMLHRRCESFLYFAQSIHQVSVSMETMGLKEQHEAIAADLPHRGVSRREAKKIRQQFGRKVDYVAEHGLLSVAEARVLKKLHAYRNESYHRDRTRVETLVSSVRLYGVLVLRLMERLTPMMAPLTFERPPEPIAFYVDGGDDAGFYGGPRMQSVVAAEMGRRWGGVDALDVADAISDHAIERLSDLRSQLDWIAVQLNDLTSWSNWDAPLVTQFVQVPLEEDGGGPVAMWRHLPVKTTMEDLAVWQARAEAIRAVPDSLDAFAAFADLEDDLEPFEAEVGELAEQIDYEIQHLIDLARGK